MDNATKGADKSTASTNGVAKPRRPARRLAVLLAATAGLVFWLGFQFHALQEELEHFWSQDSRLLALAGQVVHLDEILTMSARMAAATGNPVWEARYRRFEPQLDAALQDSARLDPWRAGEFIAQTDAANRKLVEMENSAFALIRHKDQAAAATLLFSPEYENQKQIYAAGIRQITTGVDAHISAAQAELRRHIRLVLAALMALLIVPSLFWLALLRESRRRAGAEAAAREETARRVAEERFRVLFESSHDAIMTLEPPSWKFTSANQATVAMFKAANEQDLIACEPWSLSPGRQPDGCPSGDKAKEMIETAMREGSLFFEWTHTRIGGEEFPATVLLTRMDVGGKSLLQATVRDITEQKRAEAEKGKLEGQLQQARKMEAIGLLAGGVAHNFNNLLMGIMGYTELCRDELLPEHPIRGYLDEITRNAQRSADITRQLLGFAHKQTITPKVLDLNGPVANILRPLRSLIDANINLVWIPAAAPWTVKLDSFQIDEIMTNLCINASEAINSVGKITVETANVRVDQASRASHADAVPGEYVLLTVSDDGHGMDKETVSKIFDPFFTTKELCTGTGLGLATVYGIVKQNDGFIHVDSEPGKGTAFKIYLPRVIAAATAETPVPSKPEVPGGHGETILLVEDEKSLREICHQFLSDLDYKVLVAGTPEEALKLADQQPGEILLLLTDVVMPGMDGRQLANRISAAKPDVKVLFMSGYTAEVIARRGVLNEGVQFLSKPFTRDDLALKVREVLEGPCESEGVSNLNNTKPV